MSKTSAKTRAVLRFECPHCGSRHVKTQSKTAYEDEEGNPWMRRMYRCLECREKFFSQEILEPVDA